MKALVYTGPHQSELRDEPEPLAAAGEVLVRVEACGICGSDMHAWHGHDERRPAPLILGHEAAGVVDGGPMAGRRVTINPLVTCGTCPACQSGRNNLCASRQIISMPPRPGAFATHVAIPEINCVTVPHDFPLEKAALAEPLACGWHAVRLARAIDEQAFVDGPCVILGGGAIGLGAALSARAQGARQITILETNPLRHPALAAAGPFHIANPLAENPVVDGSAAVVIDAVGFAATRSAASRLVRPGGVIVHIGLGGGEAGLDIRRMTLQEITFIGTYTYTPDDFRATAQAMFDGRMGTLDWASIRAIEEGPEAFLAIHEGREAAPKVILKP